MMRPCWEPHFTLHRHAPRVEAAKIAQGKHGQIRRCSPTNFFLVLQCCTRHYSSDDPPRNFIPKRFTPRQLPGEFDMTVVIISDQARPEADGD